jgi:hypothetical protein
MLAFFVLVNGCRIESTIPKLFDLGTKDRWMILRWSRKGVTDLPQSTFEIVADVACITVLLMPPAHDRIHGWSFMNGSDER